ncbi:MAG: hypothetical protein ACTHOF_16655 [Flavisolibacter sp.]
MIFAAGVSISYWWLYQHMPQYYSICCWRRHSTRGQEKHHNGVKTSRNEDPGWT